MSDPSMVVEVSWEVLNKVGGINTVVRSKADLLVDHYDDYLLVGPLLQGKRNADFEEAPPPERLRQAFEELRETGIHCVYGHWLIRGKPQVVLLDARQASFDTNEIKRRLWEAYKVDSLGSAYDFDEPLRWSWGVGMLIERLQRNSQEPIVAQFHEWLSGFGLLYLHSHNVPTATVFTTHATMLGRTISGATDIQLYDELDKLDAAALARQLHVADKHTAEVACAQTADVFTTVSEITGIEAEHLLGRKPDVLLFNGVDSTKYPTEEEASVLHRRAREQIRDFLDYYFFSHYTFDLEQSLIFFVSGRYEYRNKGLDVLTEALGRLNEHLKRANHRKTVIVFYFIPGETHGIKTELLEERAAFTHLQHYVGENSRTIVRTILRNAAQLDRVDCTALLDESARRHVAQLADAMRHENLPPLCTHNIPSEENDAIIAGFHAHGLLNREEDKVKVIRYPIYLTGADGLLDLTYTEAVAGSHLGLFPSYYEPWGYTPVECAALAVPAVTSDLAGFGRFIQDKAEKGVTVLRRHYRSHEEVVSDLLSVMVAYCGLDKYGRNDEKLAAKRLVMLTQWERFIKNYFQAHLLAYEKHHKAP